MIALLVLATLAPPSFNMAYTEPDFNVLAGREYASVPSYRYNAGSVVSDDRHAFQFDLKLANPVGWAEPLPSEPLSENFYTLGTVYRRYQSGHLDGWYGVEPPPKYFDLAAAPGQPAGYVHAWQVFPGGEPQSLGLFSPMPHHTTEDSLDAPAERGGRTRYELFIVSPAETADTMNLGSVPIALNGPLSAALTKEITPAEIVKCHLAAVGPLAGDQVRVVVKTTKTKFDLLGYQDWFNPPNPPGSGFYPYANTYYLWKRTTTTHYALVTFDIQKLLCEDTSIDSRRIHGVPNAEGQLPGADPNAEHRNLNFNPWFFKGGLFIGKMNLTSGDQSGTARIQLYANGTVSANSRLAVLSMVPLGSPRNSISSQMTVKAFKPDVNDANLNISYETVTWAERWGLPQGYAPGVPGDQVELPNGIPNPLIYTNWLTGISLIGSDPMSELSVRKIGLFNIDESAPSNGNFWCYFSSKEFEAQNLNSFPLNDSRPRIWLVNATVTRWDPLP